MKQIFDWLRGAILDKAFKIYDGTIAVDIHDVGNIINEAEAKWEADCCEWFERDFEDSFYYSHDGKEFDYKNDVKYWKYCPYCGKPIKISEVE